MLIIFGWVKETKELGAAITCYCYRCQRTRTWEHWKETEWVSFFMIKTIPFLSKSHVVCGGCREAVLLAGPRSSLLAGPEQLALLADFLEEHQLAEKSPLQRSFLQAQREQSQVSK